MMSRARRKARDNDIDRKSKRRNVFRSPPVVAAPPPRHIPTSVTIPAYLGGLSQTGWWILGLGMIFYWPLFSADFEHWVYFRGDLDHAAGKIANVRETNYSAGRTRHSKPVHEIDYIFTHQGATYRRVSYDTGSRHTVESWRTVGSDVQIEFPPGDPTHSRIVGLRSNVYPPWVALLGVIPLVGLGLVCYGMRQARRGLHLLRHGLVTPATLVDEESTSTRINNQPVWMLHFEYAVGGDVYRTTHKTHEAEKFRTGPTVLYLPEDPARAVFLEQIAGSPQFDEQGQVAPHSTNPTARLVTVPALTVLMHGGVFVWQLSSM